MSYKDLEQKKAYFRAYTVANRARRNAREAERRALRTPEEGEKLRAYQRAWQIGRAHV